MILSAILILIFITFSAFFSAAEAAIFSLSNTRLRQLQERYPRRGKIIEHILQKPTHLLSSIVFGNLLVNIAISSLFTSLFVNLFGDKGLILAVLVGTLFILLFGEIFPKTIALYTTERTAILCGPILEVILHIFAPFVFIMEKIVVFFSSFLLPKTKKPTLTDKELKTALNLSKKDGHISEIEEHMASSILGFRDTWVKEILTSRVDIVALDTNTSQEDVIHILQNNKHSKLPVYAGCIDNIIGIIFSKDLFLNLKQDYHSLIRPPLFIPESQKIDQLLKLFIQKNERVAIVVDQYGGTAGLVTLEDILEEIFGEVYDEFEVPQQLIEKISDRQFKLSGKTPLKVLNLTLSLNLPENFDTIAGFLLSCWERIPKSKEQFNYKNLVFTVDKVTNRKIISVFLKITEVE